MVTTLYEWNVFGCDFKLYETNYEIPEGAWNLSDFGIRSHRLVIRSLDLLNSFFRIAIRSLDYTRERIV